MSAATTTLTNWFGSTVAEVSAVITYFVKGTTRAPETLSLEEQSEIDEYLIVLESSGSLNNTCVLDWAARPILCEAPTLSTEEKDDLAHALTTL